MWIFNASGLLMPADTPMDKAPEKYTKGYRDLQVRARVKSHLENFIRERMAPLGLDYSEIEATPKKDYDYRFYTRRSDFAIAMTDEIMSIDYKKFKPMAEAKDERGRLLYEDGKEYHKTLNAIWATVSRLGNPYGGYSSYSGKGYSKRYSYSNGAYVPSTFGPVQGQKTPPTAASLAQAGIRDPESVLQAYRDQEALFEENGVQEALFEGEAGESVFDRDAHIIQTHWYDDTPDDFDVDLLAPEEQAMALVEDDTMNPQYRTARQILIIAKHVPLPLWDEIFDETEIQYLMTQSHEFAVAKNETVDPDTAEVSTIGEIEQAVETAIKETSAPAPEKTEK